MWWQVCGFNEVTLWVGPVRKITGFAPCVAAVWKTAA